MPVLTKIKSSNIADVAITSDKIATDAVGVSELADNAVDQAALADDAVGTNELANDVVINTSGSITTSSTSALQGAVTLGSGGTNWTLPTARGTEDYVLATDGVGGTSWVESFKAPVITSVSGSGTATITIVNSVEVIKFGKESATYTQDIDNFITLTPNAYSQWVETTKATVTSSGVITINVLKIIKILM